MDLEDDFFLGEIEISDFFLGNPDEEVFLGNESDSTKKLNSEEDSKSKEEDFSELYKSYNLLKIEDRPKIKGKEVKDIFEEYFKNNPEIFKFVGTDYFKSLSETEFKHFEKKCDYLISLAHEKWIDIENQHKLEDFTEAIDVLRSIFKYPQKTEAFSKEVKRTLNNYINEVLKAKTKDNVLEVSEIQELMEIAITIHLVSDNDAGRSLIIGWIKKSKEKLNFKIESYEDTFLKLVSKKEKIELLDTDQTKQKLFKEYKPLAELNYQVNLKELPSDEVLFEKMVSLLTENSILIPNTDFFILDFLEPEIQRQLGHYNFDYPINTEYFYYLKGTALNIYQLSEDQWREIALIRGIVPEDSATVAFIMGHKKESSLPGIIKLLEDNSETAKNRILAGDLETYFSHIGRKNISLKIGKLKEAYKTNTDELVAGVLELLKAGTGGIIETPVVSREKNTFDKLLKKNAELKNFVSFVVKNKSDESLITEITTDSIAVEKLQNLLSSKKKKTTYIKFLLNVMNELLLETDITQYKYAFIKVANRTQKELVDQSDAISFMNIYSVLVNSAITNGIIKNSDEIQNFTETENSMNSIYEALLNSPKESKNKKKSKFSNLFHKGEK